VCRLALSKEEVQARAALVAWAKNIGLKPSVDAAANLFLALEGREPQLPPLLIGSHIDSQPTGGKFDGAYGVLAALEAVHAISEHTDRPRRTIEVVAWMNEEGSCFAPGKHFSIDLRHDDADVIERLGNMIPSVCEAARGRCKAVVSTLLYDAPLQFPEEMRSRIARAAERLRISHMRLQSPAGHDARYLHYFCPTGMLFIPCKDGISHNEAESVTPADATAGARILAETAFELANQ
jgi:acetylornithine deacetylase/succinyl-diaminopimelate desuccinylase-like protein